MICIGKLDCKLKFVPIDSRLVTIGMVTEQKWGNQHNKNRLVT